MIRFCIIGRPWRRQRGQTFLVIVVFIAVFLLAVLGLATDYTQVWAHRQMAQGAADAACQAAAADLFLNAISPAASGQNGLQPFSWIGSPFDCSTNAGSPPCAYAALNGYSGSNVSVTFPSSLAGVASLPGGFGTVANPYVKVKITDHVPMSFTKLASSTGTVDISASAGCGLNPVAVPIPLVVLHPTSSGALSVAGAATIKVLGGPKRSIQVDSTSSTAVTTGTVDLSQAGPGGSGADFGAFGGPSTKPAGVNLGTSGNWVQPSAPIGDPWATIAAPSKPANAGTATPIPFAFNGCPDPKGCVEFTPGDYTACSAGTIPPGGDACLLLPFGGSNPKFNSGGANWTAGQAYPAGALILPTAASNAGSFVFQSSGGTAGTTAPAWNTAQTPGQTVAGSGGIVWKNMGPDSTTPSTAIFDPGLYYLGVNGLSIKQATVRMSTVAGDGTNGITFYFSLGGSNSVTVTANAGSSAACTSASPGSGTPNNCVVSYKVDGTASSVATGSVPSRVLQCPGGAANPTEVPATINGNILFAPCSGTYGSSDGKNRGFLFFQSRSTAANASWGGGGQFLLSGFMYFHSGTGTTCGTNTSCLSMNGGSGSGAFTLGNIVVDKLNMTGNSGLTMILNPQVTFQVLKPQLLQ